MSGKVHLSEEDKFKRSLKCWGDEDNRPFVRFKVDEDRDQIVYLNKWRKIRDEQKCISNITGDSIENINLIDPWGNVYSEGGNIRNFEN